MARESGENPDSPWCFSKSLKLISDPNSDHGTNGETSLDVWRFYGVKRFIRIPRQYRN